MGRVHLQAFHGMYDSRVVFQDNGYHSNRVWPLRNVAVVLEMVLDNTVLSRRVSKSWAQVYWHMPLSPDLKRQGVKSVSMCCQQVCHTLIGASVWAVLHQTKLNSRPSGINMLKCFVNCRKCLVGSVFFFPFYLMLLLLFSIFKHSEPVCTSHPQANTDASSPGCRQNHNLGNTELIKA